jgi:hypothetical protein
VKRIVVLLLAIVLTLNMGVYASEGVEGTEMAEMAELETPLPELSPTAGSADEPDALPPGASLAAGFASMSKVTYVYEGDRRYPVYNGLMIKTESDKVEVFFNRGDSSWYIWMFENKSLTVGFVFNADNYSASRPSLMDSPPFEPPLLDEFGGQPKLYDNDVVVWEYKVTLTDLLGGSCTYTDVSGISRIIYITRSYKMDLADLSSQLPDREIYFTASNGMGETRKQTLSLTSGIGWVLHAL